MRPVYVHPESSTRSGHERVDENDASGEGFSLFTHRSGGSMTGDIDSCAAARCANGGITATGLRRFGDRRGAASQPTQSDEALSIAHDDASAMANRSSTC